MTREFERWMDTGSEVIEVHEFCMGCKCQSRGNV